jgi:hypothetical protein
MSILHPFFTQKVEAMELANPLYPMRAVIRCKAQQQLVLDLNPSGDVAVLDEQLLNEIAATFFQSEQGQTLYTPFHSREAVNAAEDEIATGIVTIYQQIMAQRQSLVVQSLNALL